MSDAKATKSTRAWYGATIVEFVQTSDDVILGQLAGNCEFALLPTQRDSWLIQIDILRKTVQGLSGSIFFEFNIPRMGRRIDAVLLVGSIVFALEFKIGEAEFNRAAIEQVWDYALDLKNFHEASHHLSIIPILIASEGIESEPELFTDEDGVFRPVAVNPTKLRTVIQMGLDRYAGTSIGPENWLQAPYRPTPTIIEAARALYADHSVDAIARSDAGAKNLKETSLRIEELMDEAAREKRKIICFVTGVPGAGKTLVGLNIATRHRRAAELTHAVFLSGNGPLVAVLREALTRDEVSRRKEAGEKVRKGKVGESVKAFIQNVHHFRDEALRDHRAPVEHVVIFDEAQRAWNLQQTRNFMQRKKKQPGFNQSEPEFLISYMDRHAEWSVIICLVGGGQEINTGEAGISAWINAVSSGFPHWDMYISSRLTDSEYAATDALKLTNRVSFDDRLHLDVSMRSFRAENVSTFVKALLDLDVTLAREQFSKLKDRYPIYITRDLPAAKCWVKRMARGSERFGLLASSKAQRLKPHAIDIRVDIDPVIWFLNERADTRSSYYLEDAATEFQVQGLELDWTCVTWDADLRFDEKDWSYHDFRGSNWCNIAKPENKSFLRNAYRVLLTRARQGMVLFIPEGDKFDQTRSPAYYDRTFNYLASEIGIPCLDA